jgi:ABC-type transport system involved in cytochrome c biogenesis permease subunit
MTEFALEVLLHWVAVALYILAAVLLANAVIFDHPRRVRWGGALAAAGLVPHAAALLLRWRAVGHGPYMMKYEVLSSNAFMAVAALLVVLAWRRSSAWLSLVVMPGAIVLVAVALFSSPEARSLPPTLRSAWLVFHVFLAKVSAATFLLSVAASAVLLWKRAGRTWQWLGRAPGPESLEVYVVRFLQFGFVFWTATVAAGAVWANASWGRYWGWDAVETWSLVTWIAYGSVIHVRLFFRPRPVTIAWLTVGAFSVFVLTGLVLPYAIPSMHSAYMQ